MYFHTVTNSTTHTALLQLFEEIKASRKAIRDWVESQGATDYSAYSLNLTNHPVALLFREEPKEGWRFSKKMNGYIPDARKAAGKEIVKQIAALPIIGRMRLSDVLGFQPYTRYVGSGFGMCNHPSVSYKGDIFLLEYESDYKGHIPSDLEEITASEFRRLKE